MSVRCGWMLCKGGTRRRGMPLVAQAPSYEVHEGAATHNPCKTRTHAPSGAPSSPASAMALAAWLAPSSPGSSPSSREW